MTLEQLIHQHLAELSELDKDILQFMLANPEKLDLQELWSLPIWSTRPNHLY